MLLKNCEVATNYDPNATVLVTYATHIADRSLVGLPTMLGEMAERSLAGPGGEEVGRFFCRLMHVTPGTAS